MAFFGGAELKGFYLRHKDSLDKIFHFFIFSVILFIFLKYFAHFFAPFIFGYVLAFMLFPLKRILSDKLHFANWLSSLLSIALLIFVIVFIGVGIISRIVQEGYELSNQFPAYVAELSNVIKKWQGVFAEYFENMPDEIKQMFSDSYKSFIPEITKGLGSGVKNGSFDTVKKIPNFIMVVVLGIISSFFILNDKKKIEGFIIRQLPYSITRRMSIAKSGLISAVGGYIRAQCILMSIVCVICIVGLTILKSPYALFLGVIICIIDALPVFGSGAVFWPWAAYSFIVGNYKLGAGLIIINVTILVTRQFLEPRILGKQIGVHPIVTLLSIYIGLQVFGIFGFILGPVIMVILKAMQEAELLPNWK